ncbi:MAG: recombinase family protein, partial [Anaerotignum sp.]
ELAAQTIKVIFSMRLAGYHNRFIAEYLNHCGILAPLPHKQMRETNYTTPFQLNPMVKWSAVAIERILKNEIYTGVMVQGKEFTLSYKIKKREKKPKNTWARVENTHQAIISKEDYNVVQEIMLQDTRTAPINKKVYLLSGLLKCGDCGSNMVRKTVYARDKRYVYYICSKNKEFKNECSVHRIKESFVEDAVFGFLNNQIQIFGQRKTDFHGGVSMNEQNKMIENQIVVKRNELEKHTKLKEFLYQDYKDGLFTKVEYLNGKAYYENLCREIEEVIDVMVIKTNKVDVEKPFVKQALELKLDRMAFILFIEKIVVYDNNKIRIYLKYRNEYLK